MFNADDSLDVMGSTAAAAFGNGCDRPVRRDRDRMTRSYQIEVQAIAVASTVAFVAAEQPWSAYNNFVFMECEFVSKRR